MRGGLALKYKKISSCARKLSMCHQNLASDTKACIDSQKLSKPIIFNQLNFFRSFQAGLIPMVIQIMTRLDFCEILM